MDRRQFLQQSVAGVATMAGMAALGGRARGAEAQTPPREAVLKLGSQEGRVPGKTLRDKVLQLQDWGGVGMEFGGAPGDRVKEIKDALQGTTVKVSALCWGSKGGDLVSTDLEKRKAGIDALTKALQVAGELESTGVIFVPCFHKQSSLSPEELDKVLMDILPAIADTAQGCNSRVLLEPLNKGETFYIQRLEQAAAICRRINKPGLCMMGDFYHMCKEETNDKDAFVTAGPYLHHVHLACRARWLPGQDDRSFVEGFRGLKLIGYRDYCSLECGVKKDTKPEEEIPKAFGFLEQQWKEAVV